MLRICTALLLSTLLMLAGCTTVRPVSTDLPFTETIAVGDSVIIETQDGERYQFIVEAIDSQSIAGGNHRVATRNIKNIERKDPSKPKTLMLVGGVIASLLFAYLISDFPAGSN